MKKPLTPEAAQIRAEELCARAEHCSHEIKEKLLRWGIFPDEAERIVEQMIRTKFIDDARYARAFVRDKVEFSGWGRRKVAAALYQKRIPRDVITETLDEVDMDRYRQRLQSVLASKRRTLTDPDTYEGRTRLFRFALSRGFEPDLIIQALTSRPTPEP